MSCRIDNARFFFASLALFAALSPLELHAAPVGRYRVSAGTVLDKLTGLTWQQVAHSEQVTWDDANNYCLKLDLAGVPWRVPTLKELLTLVDYKSLGPLIDSDAFPGATGGTYWTASRRVELEGHAWFVDFANGHTGATRAAVAYRVRCVR